MKRSLILLILALPLLIRTAFAAKDPGKLTVMVYMCGSDLESLYGSASADIEEMMEAEFDPQKVSLLVMTGGTESGEDIFFDSSRTVIHEIRAHRIRTVWENDSINMGSSRTLTQMLQFGKQNYPAENYALILWDHGGGPLEGVCWDELFSLDNLKLSEITEGIRNADLGQKLSWIGFDACLMSSLETASALAQYADYMIASQETEPPEGWNYSFLSGIENDSSGRETGKRIIDAFFEGRDRDPDILTLACTDLNAAKAAAAAMDEFFGPISLSVSQENFTLLSGIRQVSAGFGKAVRAYGDDGYDLVDAADLISRISEKEGNDTALPDLLSAAVTYNRSNEPGANGLSLYHPFTNKSKYVAKWRDNYEALNFSREYTRYIRSFGTLLTGAELVDWSGLEIREDNYIYSLQMTDEQYANFSSAQLFILKRIGEGKNSESFVQVFVDRAEADENGLLKGEYPGRILYLETGEGKLAGPLGFMQTEEGDYDFLYTVYSDTPLGSDQPILYYFAAKGTEEYPEIVRKKVWNNVTESFSNRASFSEDSYNFMKILNIHRYLPESDKNEAIPAFEKWPVNYDMFQGEIFQLPEAWRLKYIEEPSDFDDLFAMFQITDVQQNSWCSPLIPVRKFQPDEMVFTRSGETDDRIDVELTGTVIDSPLDSGVRLDFSITNRTDKVIRFQITDNELLLNGRRMASVTVNNGRFPEVDPGKTETGYCRIHPSELLWMKEISSVSFTADVQWDPESYDKEAIHFRFSVTGGNISGIVPEADSLGETEQNGLLIRLLGVGPARTDSGFDLLLYVDNQSGRDFDPAFAPLINGIQTDKSSKFQIMPAGKDGMIRIGVQDDISVRQIGPSILDNTVIVPNAMEAHGIDQIEEITFLIRNTGGEMDEERIILHPDKPLPIVHGEYFSLGQTILPPENSGTPGSVLLTENDLFSVNLERVLFSKETVTLALALRNKTDHPLQLLTENTLINDSINTGSDFEDDNWNTVTLPPDSLKLTALHLNIESGKADSIGKISVTFRTKRQKEASPAVIRFVPSVPFGGDQLIWMETAEIIAEAAFDTGETIEPEFDENGSLILIRNEIGTPPDPGGYRFWQSSFLTEEEAAKIAGGVAMIVRKTDDTHIVPLAMTGISRDEKNIPGFEAPGLLLCADEEPGACICMNYGITDEYLEADLMHKPFVITDSYQFLGFTDLGIRLDYSSGQAVFSEMGFSDEVIWDGKSDTAYALIQSTGFEFDPDRGSLRQYIGKAATVRVSENVPLNGKPLILSLRPAEEEDDLYILFSFTRKNKTSFSLPLIPYPVRNTSGAGTDNAAGGS